MKPDSLFPHPPFLARPGPDPIFDLKGPVFIQRLLHMIPNTLLIIRVNDVIERHGPAFHEIPGVIPCDSFTPFAQKQHCPVSIVFTPIRDTRKVEHQRGKHALVFIQHLLRFLSLALVDSHTDDIRFIINESPCAGKQKGDLFTRFGDEIRLCLYFFTLKYPLDLFRQHHTVVLGIKADHSPLQDLFSRISGNIFQGFVQSYQTTLLVKDVKCTGKTVDQCINKGLFPDKIFPDFPFLGYVLKSGIYHIWFFFIRSKKRHCVQIYPYRLFLPWIENSHNNILYFMPLLKGDDGRVCFSGEVRTVFVYRIPPGIHRCAVLHPLKGYS